MESTATNVDQCPFTDARFGVCVLDLHKGLIYQNQRCRDLGRCVDPICRVGRLSRDVPDGTIRVFHGEELGGQFFDVVVIRDAGKEYQLIFPLDAKVAGFSEAVKGHGLTSRELEIAALIIAGLDNEALGARLGVSHNTIRTHLKSIHRKVPHGAKKLLRRT